MLSGHLLGSVLRGADEDQQAADDVSVPAGNISLLLTLITACADSFAQGRKKKSLSCNVKGLTINIQYVKAI